MKPRYQTIIFDVDGTLHDSFVSIALSYQHALREGFGIEQPDLDVFRPCVGPPIADSFAMLGVGSEDVSRAISIYQRFFYESAQHQCGMFEGTREMLQSLKDAGLRMAIASSKHIDILDYLLTRDGTRAYFDYISGVCEPLEDVSKKELIERALAHYGEPDRASVVMVGDRYYDAEGAQQAGVDFIGALYGMAAPGELERFPMTFAAENVTDVGRYILGAE